MSRRVSSMRASILATERLTIPAPYRLQMVSLEENVRPNWASISWEVGHPDYLQLNKLQSVRIEDNCKSPEILLVENSCPKRRPGVLAQAPGADKIQCRKAAFGALIARTFE